MTREIATYYGSLTIKIVLQTSSPQKIILKVHDKTMANTYFTDRYCVVNGKKTLLVRMPVSGLVSVVEIYNEANGNVEKDSSFQVLSVVKIPLERKLDVVDFKDQTLKSFIKFCTRFCYNAGVMPAGTYKSTDGRFTIIYSPKIISSNTGQQISTPARINKDTGVIEIAQDKYLTMTVPMRMAILLHEFSHFFINVDINDETEADKNALMIYLGLGYPRIEACEAFLDTFIKSSQGPNPLTPAQLEMNSRRYNIIHRFIEDFDAQNTLIKDYQ